MNKSVTFADDKYKRIKQLLESGIEKNFNAYINKLVDKNLDNYEFKEAKK